VDPGDLETNRMGLLMKDYGFLYFVVVLTILYFALT
jgi:hypothetical protein